MPMMAFSVFMVQFHWSTEMQDIAGQDLIHSMSNLPP